MIAQPRLARAVLSGIADGLFAAGFPVRTRFCRDGIAYFGPVGGYSSVCCHEYNRNADTWRVIVRHRLYDRGGGKWRLPPGAEKPRCYTDGHGSPVQAAGGYNLEFSFARSDVATVAPWIVAFIVAHETGAELAPYPELEAGRPWSRDSNYVWTRAGAAVQNAYQAEANARHVARAARASHAA